jgi:hypothetical protein
VLEGINSDTGLPVESNARPFGELIFAGRRPSTVAIGKVGEPATVVTAPLSVTDHVARVTASFSRVLGHQDLQVLRDAVAVVTLHPALGREDEHVVAADAAHVHLPRRHRRLEVVDRSQSVPPEIAPPELGRLGAERQRCVVSDNLSLGQRLLDICSHCNFPLILFFLMGVLMGVLPFLVRRTRGQGTYDEQQDSKGEERELPEVILRLRRWQR